MNIYIYIYIYIYIQYIYIYIILINENEKLYYLHTQNYPYNRKAASIIMIIFILKILLFILGQNVLLINCYLMYIFYKSLFYKSLFYKNLNKCFFHLLQT